MPYLLNGLYLLGMLILSPWLIYRAIVKGKYPHGLRVKCFGLVPTLSNHSSPTLWFHGVSVGEIHLLRQIITAYRKRRPHARCVVSTTTVTGMEEAQKAFKDLEVFYFPLDFSWAVKRALQRISPDLIVLSEGELWPNFLMSAKRAQIPVVVINARMSPRSLRRYLWLRRLTSPLWQCIHRFAVQTEEYAERFEQLGVAAEKLTVTGSVKYDGVIRADANPQVKAMRELLAVQPGEILWIVGSAQDPEEEMAVRIWKQLRASHPKLRLIVVPRQRERFNPVATLLQKLEVPFARRSELTAPTSSPVVLVDTIGELSALWALADLAYVGGSLDGKRGGQNMIEPAALGVAVTFGCHIWNFKDPASRLIDANAAIQVHDEAELLQAITELVGNAQLRAEMGARGKALVAQQQGATEKTMDVIDAALSQLGDARVAA